MSLTLTDRRAAPQSEPGTARRPRPLEGHSLSAYLCLAGLVTTVFAGQTQYLGWPFAPNRFLLLASVLVVFHERTRRDRPDDGLRFRVEPVAVVMAATALWVTCSAIAVGTLHDPYGFYALVDRIVFPFLFVIVGPFVFRTPQQRDLLLKCLVLLGIYLGATAFFEVIGPRSLVRPAFINRPELGIHYGRARGPFLSAEPDGLTMLTCAFAAWYAAGRLRWWWRPAALACVGLASLGCLLTLTRSIWVGFVLAFVVVAFREPRIRKWFPAVALVLVLGLLGALAHFPGLSTMVDDRANTQGSLYDRASTDAAALRMVQAHPLFGVGWVKFVDENQDYVRQADDIPIGYTKIEAHNVVLGRAAELGLPGCALWLLCVLLGPVRALRRTSANPPRGGPVNRVLGEPETGGWWMIAAATTVGWAVTVMLSPVPYPLPNLLVFMLAGIALSDRHPPVDHAQTQNFPVDHAQTQDRIHHER
ncbi:O-antigen ligase family protein [Spongisporangium articulatum]|uniref:O-antigen ligase family protein n=1 Tax=Spongisporangium articulatum TaxID=3362603 RepID=A0ABW8AT49_9ACTN